MSHAVQINYKQIAVECQSVCEVAQSQLCELNRLLEVLEDSSTRLLNDQTEALHREIEAERALLLGEIQKLLDRANDDAKKGVVTVDSDRMPRNAVIADANALRARCNTLASEKLPQMRALLDTLLSESIRVNQQKLLERTTGVVTVDQATQKLLDSISDEVQRQFTYLAFIKDNLLRGDELIEAGLALMHETVEARFEKEAELIRAELEASKISRETVEKIVRTDSTLSEIREAATTEIVGEKVRQKSLRIIMKAITERGFIVDKKNIKINRETNEVTMVALKASGERATFRVFLDGKFIYDFRGYEGQACQRDIEPFMTALEEVYGVHVTERQEIWSNPDKISTMKYQAMNTNKNKR